MWWFLRETKTWHYSCISDWDWVTLEFKLFHFVTPILLQWGQISSFIHELNINRPPFELQTFSQWRKMVRSSYTPPARNKQAHVAQITCCDPRDPPPPDLSQTKDSISGSSSWNRQQSPEENLGSSWRYDMIWYPAKPWVDDMISGGSGELKWYYPEAASSELHPDEFDDRLLSYLAWIFSQLGWWS